MRSMCSSALGVEIHVAFPAQHQVAVQHAFRDGARGEQRAASPVRGAQPVEGDDGGEELQRRGGLHRALGLVRGHGAPVGSTLHHEGERLIGEPCLLETSMHFRGYLRGRLARERERPRRQQPARVFFSCHLVVIVQYVRQNRPVPKGEPA
jgi:hypothetical protein